MNRINSYVAAKVFVIERQDVADAVHKHRGDQTSIVHLTPETVYVTKSLRHS